jgi:hypothetical protein
MLVQLALQGAHGHVSYDGDGAFVTYEPDPDYCGADSFTYSLNGGATATITVSVACVDDAPVANGEFLAIDDGAGAIRIPVRRNDTDIDGGPKSIVSAGGPRYGTVVLTGGGTALTYKPDPRLCKVDRFTYTLNGGSTARVTVIVACVDPDTGIARRPARETRNPLARFRFTSDEARPKFACKLDQRRWRSCGAAHQVTVKPGRHVLQVRATDRAGNTDDDPEVFHWKVLRPR